jgi:hypothetical protein
MMTLPSPLVNFPECIFSEIIPEDLKASPKGNENSSILLLGRIEIRLMGLLSYRRNNNQLKNTLLFPNSQGRNCPHFPAKNDDFHLK